MNSEEILVLTPPEIQSLLTIDECIVTVEHAFRLYGEGKAAAPAVLSMHTRDGGFHVKLGLLELSRPYFGTKVNGNFAENPKRFGLPTIQGVLILCDAEKGSPLAVMDSRDITSLRTGAATAVAAKYLARQDSRTATIVAAVSKDVFKPRHFRESAGCKPCLPMTRSKSRHWTLRETLQKTWESR